MVKRSKYSAKTLRFTVVNHSKFTVVNHSTFLAGYMCMYVCICVCMCACVCVCVFACMHLRACVYVYNICIFALAFVCACFCTRRHQLWLYPSVLLPTDLMNG